MNIKTVICIIITTLLLAVNVSLAAIQLDDKFLKSQTGNSSVYTSVDQLIEIIKNVKLSDGNHPKIIGWQRKGNIYTFTFIAGSKIQLRFEHLINRGGTESSISAVSDGKHIDAIALIMLLNSMPRDKTKSDIAYDKADAERKKKEGLENAALNEKQAERDAIINEENNAAWKEHFESVIKKALETPDSIYTEHNDDGLSQKGHNYKTFNALLKKAKENDSQAMYDLGMLYNSDSILRVKWLFSAARNNHPAASYEMSHMLSGYHELFKENRDVALAMLIKSADMGYAKAQTEYAEYWLSKKDYQNYRNYLLKAVKQGDFFGMYLLGTDYVDGTNGFKQDLKEGIRLLKVCVKAGDKGRDYHDTVNRADEKLRFVLAN